jgi:hypothetical protein
MYGYNLEFTVTPPNSSSKVPVADEWANEIKEVWQDAKSTLKMVNERMKCFYDRSVKDAPEFKLGDKVWLDGKNIKQSQLNWKLQDCRLGPFEILEWIGLVDYKLKLPKTYQIGILFSMSNYSPSIVILNS